MKEELQSLLFEYYGELLYQLDSTFDWIEKDKIRKRINAVYVLLEIEKKEETTLNKIINVIRQDIKK